MITMRKFITGRKYYHRNVAAFVTLAVRLKTSFTLARRTELLQEA